MNTASPPSDTAPPPAMLTAGVPAGGAPSSIVTVALPDSVATQESVVKGFSLA